MPCKFCDTSFHHGLVDHILGLNPSLSDDEAMDLAGDWFAGKDALRRAQQQNASSQHQQAAKDVEQNQVPRNFFADYDETVRLS